MSNDSTESDESSEFNDLYRVILLAVAMAVTVASICFVSIWFAFYQWKLF